MDSYLFKDATKLSLPATICFCNCNNISEEQIFCFFNSENWAWCLVGSKYERGESLVKKRFLNFIILSLMFVGIKLGWEGLCSGLCLREKFLINFWIWKSGLVFLWRKWKNDYESITLGKLWLESLQSASAVEWVAVGKLVIL